MIICHFTLILTWAIWQIRVTQEVQFHTPCSCHIYRSCNFLIFLIYLSLRPIGLKKEQMVIYQMVQALGRIPPTKTAVMAHFVRWQSMYSCILQYRMLHLLELRNEGEFHLWPRLDLTLILVRWLAGEPPLAIESLVARLPSWPARLPSLVARLPQFCRLPSPVNQSTPPHPGPLDNLL